MNDELTENTEKIKYYELTLELNIRAVSEGSYGNQTRVYEQMVTFSSPDLEGQKANEFL